jgi:hypothetical protein
MMLLAGPPASPASLCPEIDESLASVDDRSLGVAPSTGAVRASPEEEQPTRRTLATIGFNQPWFVMLGS